MTNFTISARRKITEVQWSVRFNLFGNEGEGIYGKVIFDLGLEVSAKYWEVDMLGNVTQLNIRRVRGNRNTQGMPY